MNILLFRPAEVSRPLSRRDPRARHLLEILRRQPGDTFDAGMLNGPRGKGTLVAVGDDNLVLSFIWSEPPPPLASIHLLIGLPRPQTARDILRDMTTLGVAALHFIRSDKGEASYATSTLWKNAVWEEHAIAGAAQAFLDNYEATMPLSQGSITSAGPAVLAIGAERGWSDSERKLLRSSGFTFASLGPRVLRTETACVVGVTLLKAKLGLP